MKNIKSFLVSLSIPLLLASCATVDQQTKPSDGSSGQSSQTSQAPGKREGVRGELVPQRPHTAAVQGLDYASEHDFFVTGAKDSTIKVWQPDGQLIRTIAVGMWVYGLKLFGHDKYVMAYSNMGQVKVVDVETGRLANLPGSYGSVHAMALSRDANLFAISNAKGEVNVSGLNGKHVITLKMPPLFPTKQKTYPNATITASKLVISPNGRLVIASNMYGEIVMWSIEGKMLEHIKLADTAITSMDFYDNKLLVAFGFPYLPTRNYSRVTAAVAIYDISKDTISKTMFTTPSVDQAIFAGNSQKIYAMTLGNKSKNINVYDFKGKLLETFKISSDRGVSRLASSVDGSRIITVGNGINMWSPTGQRLLRIKNSRDYINEVALNKKDMVIATPSSNGTIKLWSIYGKYLGVLKIGSQVSTLEFMNDGQRLVVCTSNDIQIWNYKEHRLLQKFKAQKYGINDIAVAPGDNWFVAVGNAGKAQLFYRREDQYYENQVKVSDKRSYTVAITKDGNGFITETFKEGMKYYNSKGEKKWEIAPSRPTDANNKPLAWQRYCGLDISASGQNIAALGARRAAIYGMDGKLVQTIPLGSSVENLCDIKFINQDKQLLLTVRGGIALWDIASGKVMTLYKGHTDTVTSLVYVPDTTLMISAAEDGVVRLWNLNTGYSAGVTMEKGEWIIYDQYGYFDASIHGGKIINFSKGFDTYPVDQFALYFNRPDMIYAALGLAGQDYLDHLYAQYKRRINKAFINEEMLSPDIEVPQVKLLSKQRQDNELVLKIKMMSDHFGLKSYQVYDNNVPLFGRHGTLVNGHETVVEKRVNLVDGNNVIEIAALNENGSESYRVSTIEVVKGTRKSDLYFVGLGVSKYQQAQLDLKYAAKDVMDLSKAITGKYKHNGSIHTKLFLDKQVTKASLAEIKQFFSGAGVNDRVVLFISGHGAYERSKLAEYYYITSDVRPDDLENTAISWTEIEDLLYGVKANKKLMFMDTCESGEMDVSNQLRAFAVAKSKGFYTRANKILGDLKNTKREPRKYLYYKDRYIYNDIAKGSGTYVFSSSAGGEMSFESERLKNGLFTHALLDALNKQSKAVDKDRDGVISIDELVEYVSLKVSTETGGAQNPTVDRGNPKQEFLFSL